MNLKAAITVDGRGQTWLTDEKKPYRSGIGAELASLGLFPALQSHFVLII
ncbi:hypothetical protein [Martelella endophytica]|nr:hypothetical protein [Martelella endophytica]